MDPAAQGHEYYDRHRFDNYSAWLDREDKLKAGKDKKPLGWGFCDPKPPAPHKDERPFVVVEQGMVSGQMLLRKYEHLDSAFPTEGERANPWHYPNDSGLQDHHHYGDHRRRSCHVDPHRWKPLPGDAILRDAVSDATVTAKMFAEKGERRRPVPPDMLALREAHVTLDPNAIRELKKDERVDFSCMDVPTRELHTPTSRSSASRGGLQTPKRWALSGTNAPPIPPPGPAEGGHGMPPPVVDESAPKGKWGWCMSGRPTKGLGISSPEEQEMIRTRSLPVMIAGSSMLVGNLGGEQSAFHGMHTRKFGPTRWDGRMRGGRLARDGWAGTFPAKEARPP